MLRKVLLVCGILSPVLYAISDALAGMQWEGYSFRDQTISELGAIGAPSRPLFTVLLLVVFGLMVKLSLAADPAERSAIMRLLYRGWRPTRLGRWVNRVQGWWSGLGLPPRFQAVLEVRGRASGRTRSNPVVIASMEGKQYLVSMLGAASDWVKNVEAAHGEATIRQGRRRPVHLVIVPPEERAPILREYVRIALSGRRHFPLPVDAPLSAFEGIRDRYPVYRIDPA